MDRLLLQHFTNEIPAERFQEQLNHELQRIDEGLSLSDVDDLHSQVTLSSDSAEELATSRDLLNQFFKVIATEIDLKYFEDEDLTELLPEQNSEFAFASLD